MEISLLWKILLYTWTASEIYLAIRTRTRSSGGKIKDRYSFPILWATIFLSISASETLSQMTSRNMFSGASWPPILTIAMLVFGMILRWTAILSLGKAFSVNVAIRPEQKVYQSGLYSVLRHPSYTGLLLALVAVGLSERNWISFAVVLIPTTAALLYRIHVEESALQEAFGAEYVSYSRRTKRLIPGIY